MAIKEYKYQKATQKQLERCIKWCQNQFQLQAWEITLEVGDKRPEETADRNDSPDDVVYGAMAASPDRLKALVFINDANCKKENENLYTTAIHEMSHVMLYDSRLAHELQEPIVRALEPLLYRLYCKENGLKITPEKLGY
jgi:hypothetical protein